MTGRVYCFISFDVSLHPEKLIFENTTASKSAADALGLALAEAVQYGITDIEAMHSETAFTSAFRCRNNASEISVSLQRVKDCSFSTSLIQRRVSGSPPILSSGSLLILASTSINAGFHVINGFTLLDNNAYPGLFNVDYCM